jgi:single-strand DNA-binding protein
MQLITIVGNVAADPEYRTFSSGTAKSAFKVAVSRAFKDKDGNKQTDYFNIVAWKKLAELAGKTLKKGTPVVVIGEMQNRSYDAKDGTKRYTNEINASVIGTVLKDEMEGFTQTDEDLPF